MRILLACYCSDHKSYLNKLVGPLRAMGHEVRLKKSSKHYQWLLKETWPQVVALWNGASEKNAAAITKLRKRYKGRLLFIEIGWFPGAPKKGTGKTVYFDRGGINALSEIRKFEPPPANKAMQRELRQYLRRLFGHCPPAGDYTLVPLQLSTDTNIIRNSPNFKDMQRLIYFVEKVVPGHRIFKRHPRDKTTYKVSQPDSELVVQGNLYKLLAAAKQVVGINSTVLLEALTMGKPVAALGAGLFSGRGVVLECGGQPARIADLSGFRPDPNRRLAFLYELIFRRQVWLPDPGPSLRRNRVLQEVLEGKR